MAEEYTCDAINARIQQHNDSTILLTVSEHQEIVFWGGRHVDDATLAMLDPANAAPGSQVCAWTVSFILKSLCARWLRTLWSPAGCVFHFSDGPLVELRSAQSNKLGGSEADCRILFVMFLRLYRLLNARVSRDAVLASDMSTRPLVPGCSNASPITERPFNILSMRTVEKRIRETTDAIADAIIKERPFGAPSYAPPNAYQPEQQATRWDAESHSASTDDIKRYLEDFKQLIAHIDKHSDTTVLDASTIKFQLIDNAQDASAAELTPLNAGEPTHQTISMHSSRPSSNTSHLAERAATMYSEGIHRHSETTKPSREPLAARHNVNSVTTYTLLDDPVKSHRE